MVLYSVLLPVFLILSRTKSWSKLPNFVIEEVLISVKNIHSKNYILEDECKGCSAQRARQNVGATSVSKSEPFPGCVELRVWSGYIPSFYRCWAVCETFPPYYRICPLALRTTKGHQTLHITILPETEFHLLSEDCHH